jgi:hypothetical protein
MKKTLLSLAFSILLLAVPAFAQHGRGSSGHGGSRPSGAAHGGQAHGPAPRAALPRGLDHDRFGHDFRREDFGRAHWTRFGVNDGRWYGGRREFFFGGFWFYGNWPGWFYNCNTYFDIGPDGYWYAYCYDNPGLYFRVFID